MTEEGARGKAGEGGKEEEGQGRIPPALGVDFAGTKGTVPALQKVHGKMEHRPPRGLPPPPLPGFVRLLWLSCRFRGERSSGGERGFAVSDESRLQINRLC